MLVSTWLLNLCHMLDLYGDVNMDGEGTAEMKITINMVISKTSYYHPFATSRFKAFFSHVLAGLC